MTEQEGGDGSIRPSPGANRDGGSGGDGPRVIDTDTMLAEEFEHLFGADFHPSQAGADGEASAFDAACRVMPPDRAPRALCLSGGGIRSATFALGVLQGLNKAEQLDQFAYLSTVSGGGYIGSWLSRWRANSEDGESGPRFTMERALRETPDVVRPPEHPIRRLRGFSSYLSPSWGFSVDTLTAVTILLRNLLFNWLVWVPLLLCVAMVPRALVAVVAVVTPTIRQSRPSTDMIALTALWFPLLSAGVWALAALVVLLGRTMSEQSRERLSRWGGRCLLYGLAWSALFLLLIYLPLLLLSFQSLLVSSLHTWLGIDLMAKSVPGVSFGITGLITAAVSAAGFWSRYGTEIRTRTAGIAATLGARVLDLAALVAIVAIAVSGALAAHKLPSAVNWLATLTGLPLPGAASPALDAASFKGTIATGRWSPVLWSIGLALLALLASAFVGNNRYSLHGLYGNRLVRAYLGSAHRNRTPDKATDFDPEDNVGMAELRGPGDELRKPFHIVNMTLNLARPTKASLDWQERKGASFVATPLHCGSPVTGYMAPEAFDGKDGMTLGRAMTISGAAASPNMGFHSSPLVTLLLTIANIRLGWWVRNPDWLKVKPGTVQSRARKLLLAIETGRTDPFFALYYALLEATSGTGHDSAWLYLSDGGHFDNLGLYEMVRRRCRRIVVIDAGCDGEFRYADLMTAIRLVQVDLAVPIDLPAVLPGQKGPGGDRRIAVGRIRYSALPGWSNVDGDHPSARRDGQLLIVKPILLDDDPPSFAYYRDVSRKGKNAFPHHSTLDQFFDESQFESYRALGEFSAAALVRNMEELGEPGGIIDVRKSDGTGSIPGVAKPADAGPPAATPAPWADMGAGKLLLALLAGIGTLGVASGVGQSVADTVASSFRDRESVVEHQSTTERIVRNDKEVLDALLRLIDLLEKALAERPAGPVAYPQTDPRLIIEIDRLIAWLRAHSDRAMTVNLDPTLLRKISDQLELLRQQSDGHQKATMTQLQASVSELQTIARSVPATGPRRNIRSGQ